MQTKWKSVEMFLIEHYNEEYRKGIIVMKFNSHNARKTK